MVKNVTPIKNVITISDDVIVRMQKNIACAKQLYLESCHM